MKKYSGGNFIEWLLILVAISVVIFAIVVPKDIKKSLIGFSPFRVSSLATSTRVTESRAVSSETPRTNTTGGRSSIGSQTSSTAAASSLALGTGNASGTYEPADEYITIENRGTTPVDISGYKLENGKSSRSYAVGSNETRFASDTALIPQGARVLSPTGANVLGSIILQPGDIAIITTGSPGNLTPKIVSFKENKCTGYLAETYRFVPDMGRQCLSPRKEAGVTNLSQPCQDFINGIRTCHTPKFNTVDAKGNTVDSNGNTCINCVDGVSGLTTQCLDFIRSRYSYAGCLATHSADADFEYKTWRVYLYKPMEMWASFNEIVSLYDRQGNLVAKTSY